MRDRSDQVAHANELPVGLFDDACNEIGCSSGLAGPFGRVEPRLSATDPRSATHAARWDRGRLVIMAFDACRFGWPAMPALAELFGAVLIAAAFYGWGRVLRENSFAVTNVRLQPERGRIVVSAGP